MALISLAQIEVGGAHGNRTRLSALRGPRPNQIDEHAVRQHPSAARRPVNGVKRGAEEKAEKLKR